MANIKKIYIYYCAFQIRLQEPIVYDIERTEITEFHWFSSTKVQLMSY